jgi:NADP-dependent 3-hydroxy acid dehydrogenase YdfG
MSTSLTTGGPVVAITGAGRGIGLATARELHSQGARLVLGDIDTDAVEKAAADLGDRAVAKQLDVSDEDSFAHFVGFAGEKFGLLDVLVNNAGIMPIGPYLDETVETAQRAVDINLMGCLIGMKAALPEMVRRGSGQIINVSSIAGKSPVPGGLTYAATKAAVVSATETARVEYARSGVSFTCVMPSFTNTELIAGTKGTRFIKNVEPEDVAAAIAAAVKNPRHDVYVPGSVGAVAKMTPLIGRKMRDALNRSIKADRTFLDVDNEARAAYDRRIAAVPSKPELEEPPAEPSEDEPSIGQP